MLLKKIFLIFFIPSLCFSSDKIKKQELLEFKNNLINHIQEGRKKNELPELRFDSRMQSIFKEVNELGGKRLPNKKEARVTREDELKKKLIDAEFHASIFFEKTFLITLSKRKLRTSWGKYYILGSFEDAKNYIFDIFKFDKRIQSLYNKDIEIVYLNVDYNPDIKRFRLTALYSSKPFATESNPLAFNAKNIRKDCAKIKKKFSYLPWLWTNNIKYDNNQLYFYYEGFQLIKKLDKFKIKIALDVLNRDQVSCNKATKVNLSKSINGKLYHPVSIRKGAITSDSNYTMFFGEYPKEYKKKDIEANILIINKKSICFSIKPNKMYSENLKIDYPTFVIDTTTKFKPNNYITYTLPYKFYFKKNSSQLTQEDKNAIISISDSLKVEINKITINSFSSIEGKVEKNKILQESRAKAVLEIFDQNLPKGVKHEISLKSNWKDFYNSIEGSSHQAFVDSLSKEDFLDLINTKSLPFELEPFLKNQRYCEVTIGIRSLITPKDLNAFLLKRYKVALTDFDREKSLYYQIQLAKLIPKGKISWDSLKVKKIRHLKQNVSLNNNKIVFDVKYGNLNFHEALKQFDKQSFINSTHPYLNYNKVALTLFIWQRDTSLVKEISKLKTTIYSLYNSQISKEKVDKLMFQFYVVSADYYYTIGNSAKRQRQLKRIKSLIRFNSDSYSKEEILRYTNYFIFQLRLDWAAEFLYYYISVKKMYDEDLMFKFLQLAGYFKKKYPASVKKEYFKRAAKINKIRFCKFFSKEEGSFQLLLNKDIKEIYCKFCNEG